MALFIKFRTLSDTKDTQFLAFKVYSLTTSPSKHKIIYMSPKGTTITPDFFPLFSPLTMKLDSKTLPCYSYNTTLECFENGNVSET